MIQFTLKMMVISFLSSPVYSGIDYKIQKPTFVSENVKNLIGKYEYVINHASRRYKIEPALIKAIIATESSVNSDAISHRGAQGLMQLMPGTSFDLGVMDAFDPRENILAGTKYFRYLLNKFRGDITLALAAYNAGEERVLRKNKIPEIAETKNYVSKVMGLFQQFRKSN